MPQPDENITKLEDALIPATRNRLFPIGTEGAKVPGRMGYGTKGLKTIMGTNHFQITTAYEAKQSEQPLHRYDVEIKPEITSREKKRRLFDMILLHPKLRGKTVATDYAKIIITTEQVSLENGQWVEKKVLIPRPPENSQTPQSSAGPSAFSQETKTAHAVDFRVTNTGSFSLRHIIDYLRSTAPDADYAALGDLIQMLNIITCRKPNAAANVRDAGRNRFYPHEGHPGLETYNLGGGLQALRGYYASVRPAIGRLLLNLNVTAGAFYKPLPLNLLIAECGARDHGQRENFIRNLKVKVVYRRDGEENPFQIKVKTILGFAKSYQPDKGARVNVKRFGNAHEVKFSYVDSEHPEQPARETTIYDYFRSRWGITLRQPDLPVLAVGLHKDPVYVPVELCVVLPGQPYKSFLPSAQTTEMLRFASRFPNLSAESICGNPGNGLQLFGLRDQPQALAAWGFSAATSMITVPARILSCPQVKYLNKAENPRNGSWNLLSQRFARPGKFTKWATVVINKQGPRGTALTTPDPEALFNELGKHLKDYGMDMGAGRQRTQTLLLKPLTQENRASNDQELEKMFNGVKGQQIPVLLVVLPDQDKWLYARLKYWGDIKYGVHTICSVGQKMQKPGGQGMLLGNLALKFNIKGGGVNHVVNNMFGEPLDTNTMVMGIDVTHPSPGSSSGAPSIACAVASVDEHLTQWPGSVRIQQGRVEMVSGLKEMVLERLKLWRKRHSRLPTRIVLYRDGVSESQYEQVLLLELPEFREAFKDLYGKADRWPKMATIIVGKRHHTRFFPTKIEDADYNPQKGRGSFNPKPGTIVDRHISGRVMREFWLQAHQGLQGTARPAHYVVIQDEITFEADELEAFTHNMCYLFNRATKAVSICPPAYYADLLCERGRAYLYTVLAEGRGSDSGDFNPTTADWTGGVHPSLAESTWYI